MNRHDAPLPADRLARRWEHLMTETVATAPRARLSRRGKAQLGGILAVSVAGAGGLAAADRPTVFHRADGLVQIDGQNLTPLYYGQKITLEQVADLNRQGNAMVSVQNIEGGCHGVGLYFDTSAEANAYVADFTARSPAMHAKQTPTAHLPPVAPMTRAPIGSCRCPPSPVPVPDHRPDGATCDAQVGQEEMALVGPTRASPAGARGHERCRRHGITHE